MNMKQTMLEKEVRLTLVLAILVSGPAPLWARRADRPMIHMVEPASGIFAGGTIHIEGENFLTDEGEALQAVITDEHNYQVSTPARGHTERLQLRVPEDLSPGKVKIVIMRRSRDGRVEQTKPFPYLIQAPPQVKAVQPMHGSVGATVTIRGKNLGPEQGSSYVLFVGEMVDRFRGSVRALIVSWEDDKIVAAVPYEMAQGPCQVRVVRMDPETNRGILTAVEDGRTRFVVMPRS